MLRRFAGLLVALLVWSAIPATAAGPNLSPQARRDLAVLVTVYPGLITAIEADRTGRIMCEIALAELRAAGGRASPRNATAAPAV